MKGASYIAGLGFAIVGIMKLKAHKDNPTQVPLSQPMVLLIVATLLMFIPSLISTAQETIFEGGEAAAEYGK